MHKSLQTLSTVVQAILFGSLPAEIGLPFRLAVAQVAYHQRKPEPEKPTVPLLAAHEKIQLCIGGCEWYQYDICKDLINHFRRSYTYHHPNEIDARVNDLEVALLIRQCELLIIRYPETE